MFVSYYWITKKQKQLPYFRANFVWAVIWRALQTTSNPDSNPQAGLWIPVFWMNSAGLWLAHSRAVRTVETHSQANPLAPKLLCPFPSDHIELMLYASPWDQSMCQTE